MTINRVEFVNFLCHFGREKVMLDYLMEIALPAFLDDTLIRHRGQENVSAYFFYDVHIETLETTPSGSVLGVYGQFVKNVNLTRTQIFDPSRGLVQDARSMASSPSSTFLLILNSHQLAFLPRTRHAPTLGEFEATTRNFISRKYKKYIDDLYESRKRSPDTTTKTALRAETPPPEIHVVPLANLDSVADFVARFEKLRSIDFRLLRPNPAIDADDTFRDVRGILESLGANNGKIVATNSTEGLNKTAAVTVIDQAARGGNQDIVLKGEDQEGAILTGSNDDFKISVPLGSIPQTRPDLVKKLFHTLKDFLPVSTSVAASEGVQRQAKLDSLARDI